MESLGIATRILAAVVNDADPRARAVIFKRPGIQIGSPADFVPRGAMELILHAHDVCLGLAVPFEPPASICHRLREHTRPWPMWTMAWERSRSDRRSLGRPARRLGPQPTELRMR